MSGVPGKIVLKSTTKISLTERYALMSAFRFKKRRVGRSTPSHSHGAVDLHDNDMMRYGGVVHQRDGGMLSAELRKRLFKSWSCDESIEKRDQFREEGVICLKEEGGVLISNLEEWSSQR